MAKGRVTLTVGGGKFEDWTTIWVQRTYGDSFHQFKFTCAEREGASAGEVAQASQQFKPGDECKVELDGQLAITGEIITRQVAYDSNNHGVQLQGVSKTWRTATSSVMHKTGKLDGKKYMEGVDEILQPTDAAGDYEIDGQIDESKMEYEQIQKGELIFPCMERMARDAKVIVTCTKEGKFKFVGENPKTKRQGTLEEGRNILRCQATISNQQKYKRYYIDGNTNASDGGGDVPNMQKAAEQRAQEEGDYEGGYRVLLTPHEMPRVKDEQLKKRAKTEVMWSRAHEVQATITVVGWSPEGEGGELWEEGAEVMLKSPMAMINQTMAIQSVTFTQDSNSGSLTTLVLVAPHGLNRQKRFQPSPGTSSRQGMGGSPT